MIRQNNVLSSRAVAFEWFLCWWVYAFSSSMWNSTFLSLYGNGSVNKASLKTVFWLKYVLDYAFLCVTLVGLLLCSSPSGGCNELLYVNVFTLCVWFTCTLCDVLVGHILVQRLHLQRWSLRFVQIWRESNISTNKEMRGLFPILHVVSQGYSM